MIVFSCSILSRPRSCSWSCRRASCRATTPASCSCSPRPTRTSASTRWRASTPRRRRSSAHDPNVAGVMAFIGVSRQQRDAQSRPHDRHAEAAQRTRLARRGRSRNCVRSCTGIPGFKVYLQNIPIIRIGGQLTKTQYQYTLQDIDTKELFAFVPKLVEAIGKLPGFQDVTSDLLIAHAGDRRQDRPRRGRGRRRHRRRRSRARCTPRSARSRSRRSTRRSTSIWVLMQVDPKRQDDPNVSRPASTSAGRTAARARDRCRRSRISTTRSARRRSAISARCRR